MSAKTNTIIKVDKKLHKKFSGHAQIKGQKIQDALERGMQLYIEESEKEQREGRK